jgi:hypothetical protein
MSVVIIRKRVDSILNKELLNRYRRLRQDLLWILASKEKLRLVYANRYIAVENKTVKFTDTTMEGILFEIHAAGRQVEDFTIEYIGEQPVNFLF